jgi:hypothetical protein
MWPSRGAVGFYGRKGNDDGHRDDFWVIFEWITPKNGDERRRIPCSCRTEGADDGLLPLISLFFALQIPNFTH